MHDVHQAHSCKQLMHGIMKPRILSLSLSSIAHKCVAAISLSKNRQHLVASLHAWSSFLTLLYMEEFFLTHLLVFNFLDIGRLMILFRRRRTLRS
jgi:hypothetical protein